MTDLKSMNLQEIEELISSLNCPKFRAKQIFQWINKGVTSFDEMKNVKYSTRFYVHLLI